MALWLPMIDSAKSYKSVMLNLQKSVPTKHTCINSNGVGKPQEALLDYYTNLRILHVKHFAEANCDLLLIQDDKYHQASEPPSDAWRLIWLGKRAADRHEQFRLYQKAH